MKYNSGISTRLTGGCFGIGKLVGAAFNAMRKRLDTSPEMLNKYYTICIDTYGNALKNSRLVL
jgi:hypothetical protein